MNIDFIPYDVCFRHCTVQEKDDKSKSLVKNEEDEDDESNDEDDDDEDDDEDDDDNEQEQDQDQDLDDIEENDEELEDIEEEDDEELLEEPQNIQPLNSQISNIFGDDKSSNENSEEEIEKTKVIDPEDFGDMEDCESSEVEKYMTKASGRTSRNSALKSDKTISPMIPEGTALPDNRMGSVASSSPNMT